MTKYVLFFLIISGTTAFSQTHVLSFQDATKNGISIAHLDSSYKSAVHVNTVLAVFKTPEEQNNLQRAYVSFIQNMSAFLTANNFKWDKQVRSYNRAYMNADGTVEYFIFQFSNQLSAEREAEFLKLVRLYTKNNKFPITAVERFAQCSPVTYGR